MDLTKEQVWRFYETLARIVSRREGVDVKLVSLELKEDSQKEGAASIEIKNWAQHKASLCPVRNNLL